MKEISIHGVESLEKLLPGGSYCATIAHHGVYLPAGGQWGRVVGYTGKIDPASDLWVRHYRLNRSVEVVLYSHVRGALDFE